MITQSGAHVKTQRVANQLELKIGGNSVYLPEKDCVGLIAEIQKEMNIGNNVIAIAGLTGPITVYRAMGGPYENLVLSESQATEVISAIMRIVESFSRPAIDVKSGPEGVVLEVHGEKQVLTPKEAMAFARSILAEAEKGL